MFRTAAGVPPRPGRLITASKLLTRTATRSGSTSPTSPSPTDLVADRALDLVRILLDLARAVASPRPEEAPQPVSLGSGHNVHVEMRYRLADYVVDRHEGALSAQRRPDRTSDSLCHRQERNHEFVRQAQ